MLIVRSKSTDVFRNLAVEEWLLDHAHRLQEGCVHGETTPGGADAACPGAQRASRQKGAFPVLFLYVNDPCVVIGKNQNPWRECRLSLMEKESVPLARRISGGGAVYHDTGNLNVSVMVPRTEYVEQKQYDLIFQVLKAFGIHASKPGKSSLTVDGLKFSGQAFCHRRDRTLHHGTQLINCDLSRLGRYLGPEIQGIETKSVASVPAQVANLSQFAPELTVEKLSAALIEQFKALYGSHGIWVCWSDEDVQKTAGTQFLPMLEKNSSKDWNFCHTPKFVFQGLEVVKGRVMGLDGAPWFDEWLSSEENSVH